MYQATYTHSMANKFCLLCDNKQGTHTHTQKHVPCNVITVYAGILIPVNNACKCVGDMDLRKWYTYSITMVTTCT